LALQVGWGGDRTAVICDLLNKHAAPGSRVVVLSELPLEERLETTRLHRERVAAKDQYYYLDVIHQMGSPMSHTAMSNAVRAAVSPPGELPG
jgi:hypothetical protein